jgi:hypothetical protein
MRTGWPWLVIGALACGAVVIGPRRDARACGCFALPSPATPVVQAGERILFAKDGNDVVAVIQVQYQGAADRFAWLIPLPAVPRVELGTDEVFTQLEAATRPDFRLTTEVIRCDGTVSRSSGGFGCGAGFASDGDNFSRVGDMGGATADAGSLLVAQAAVGPYEYAVLKADDRAELLTWLSDNRYFVPTGTDDALTPYIRPGAYFLAIKLRSGESTGDLVPIVLRYTADLPMIPIMLTAVGAVPNMGILVYVLGDKRAIPRNYYHSVANELFYWLGESTYQRLIINAAAEAPEHHTFFTQYAGREAGPRVAAALGSPTRFGNRATLATFTDPAQYLRELRTAGFNFTDGALLSLLLRYIPMPDELVARGVTPGYFYTNYDLYAAQLGGGGDGGAMTPTAFDPVALTNELWTRIVEPTRATQALFATRPYLTRLYTVLSPADMTKDPVFSFANDLPDVANVRTATATLPCRGQSWIVTDQGLKSYATARYSRTAMPASLRIEVLTEEMAPEVITDNRAQVTAIIGDVVEDRSTDRNSGSGGGCDTTGSAPLSAGATLLLAAAGIGLAARRRRRD